MKKLAVSFALIACLVGSVQADKRPLTLENVGGAADCADKASKWRVWCVINDWGKGKPELPKGPLMGITVEVPTYRMGDKPYKEAFATKVRLASLAVDGSRIKVEKYTPTSKGEGEVMAAAITSLTAVLEGKAKTAAIKKELAMQVKGIKAFTKVKEEGGALAWATETVGQIRKVGKVWVAVETTGSDDASAPTYITVLTDAWQ